MSYKSVVKRETIEDIVHHRNRALALLRKGFEALREADQVYRLASSERTIGIFAGLTHSDWFALESDFRPGLTDELIEKCRKRIDGETWQYIINSSGMTNLMDGDQCSDLKNQLRNEPPEVSMSTAIATLEQLYSNKDHTFKQSVVNIFNRLCNGYMSNSVFSIGSRMIMTGAVGGWQHWLDWDARNRLSDLDRMLYILQGLSYPGKENDAGSTVELACREKKKTVDTEWMHIKIYGNGNLHIWIRNKQLIDKINGVITEYYGETLPDQQRKRRAY